MSSAPPHRPSRRSRSCSASPRDGAASFTPPPAVSSPLDRVSWSVSSSDCSPPCQGLQDASRPAGLLDSTSSAVPVPARSPRASFAQVCDSSAAAKISLPLGRRSSSPAAAAPVLAIGNLGSSRPLHAGVAPVAMAGSAASHLSLAGGPADGTRAADGPRHAAPGVACTSSAGHGWQLVGPGGKPVKAPPPMPTRRVAARPVRAVPPRQGFFVGNQTDLGCSFFSPSVALPAAN
ncbi:hypothetical protein BRADI_1g30798v3 [Brachypodium distachyon]|uniref:Uncharacterized protein n=1 Tax=Brachypodium distachyon TaxID=15368 RepID=A0A2K2DM46_BRADI|nr:hypothetical protein BRADI_1g30798v3 [Brachypodium distachyon]